MLTLTESTTIGEAFRLAAQRFGPNVFLAVPPNPDRSYHAAGYEITYSSAASAVDELTHIYSEAGYGVGHRVGLLLDNRPEHLLHKLALNAIGACCVPINADLREPEIRALLEHCKADLIVVLESRAESIERALAGAIDIGATVAFERFGSGIPSAHRVKANGPVTADMPASILYTSGTTGKPKGCVLSHRYELASGMAYASRGGLAEIRIGADRIYNPLPLYHVNASILSFYCVLLTGNCQIQTDRFSPHRFWHEVRATRATVVHYLGVVIPMLLNQPATPGDRETGVRFGFGAGVEPPLHRSFEQRFGFPLLELWGMTEMVRVLVDCHEPRRVGTRAFGRPTAGVEVMVVDADGARSPLDTPGEMLIRHSERTPRKDFFSGYLDDAQATEDAWRGGWFHTGDVVSQDASGMLYFVDRRKNIIRRSGENIAAAEVEATLLTHPRVMQAAVIAVPDPLREEEVFACVVLEPSLQDAAARREVAVELFAFCHERLAYFKSPGYVWLTDNLPTTGTQKIQKHAIFPADVDPRRATGVIDLRSMKRR